MESKRNRWLLPAFICSIVPIGITVVLGGFCLPIIYLATSGGCFDDIWKLLILVVGFIIALFFIMPLGIISVVLGIIATGKLEARDKTPAVVAIILGALEVVTVIGWLYWVNSKF